MKITKKTISALMLLGLMTSFTANASYIFVVNLDAMKNEDTLQEAIAKIKNPDGGSGAEEEETDEVLSSWQEFASKYGYNTGSPEFSQFVGGNISNVSSLPYQIYPQTHLTGDMIFSNGQLTHTYSLRDVREVGGTFDLSNNNLTSASLFRLFETGEDLLLNNNMLTNADGLGDVFRVIRDFNLSNNQLANVSGLDSLFDVGGVLDLSNNELTVINTNDFPNLFRVTGKLDLSDNNLRHINGINILDGAGILDLRGNPLETITGLNMFGGANFVYIDSPYLTDITGLSNFVFGTIVFDTPYLGVKLDSGSYFCQSPMNAVVDNTSSNAKHTVCNQ